MKWIESNGGPLILMADDMLTHWKGIDGDYERACAIDEWLGVLDVGSREALVLGDESLPTMAWVRKECFWLVGWYYAPDEPTVVEWLEQASVLNFPDPPVVVDFGSRSVVLFDSAWSGNELNDIEVLRFEIPTERCEVRTLNWEPDKHTSLRLNSFRPVGQWLSASGV